MLADESALGSKLRFKEIDQNLGLVTGLASNVVYRATQVGVIEAAMGRSGEALKGRPRPPGSGLPRVLLPETEREIAVAYATGEFTKADLARFHGVSGNTVTRAIQRASGVVPESVIVGRLRITALAAHLQSFLTEQSKKL